jgi:hypothetical protein
MSYDIDLYERQFLKRAIDEQLGDWTNADPISSDSLSLVRQWLIRRGYVIDFEREGYCELLHPNKDWGLQVSLCQGQVGFTVPYWDDVERAIEVAQRDAREIAAMANLGYYDSQIGEVHT